MGFLKRLFGGGDSGEHVDKNGIYIFVRSPRAADAVSKLRIDKTYDLNSAPSGYVWHKTIVDPKYFSRIEAVIYFDNKHQITNSDLKGGELITEEEYEAIMTERGK